MQRLLYPLLVSLIVLGAGCSGTATNSNTPTNTSPAVNQPVTTTANANSSNTNTQAGTTLSMSEVAKHSSSSSCWLLIQGSVYDVTSYLAQHPGGSRFVTPYCGQEATTAFDTMGGRGSAHSAMAEGDLQSLLLGQLNATVHL